MPTLTPRILFSHPGCPFAHRTRALLTHLQLPFEIRETSLILKDAEFLRLSPTGKVPMLVEPSGIVLYESQVIAEYLAESHGFPGWSNDPDIRAKQRLAVQQFDAQIVPLLFYRPVRAWPLRWLSKREETAVTGELDLLEALVEMTPARSHLGLLLAPFWIRFRWLDFLIGSTERRFLDRPRLAAWLDEAAALPEIQSTIPNQTAYILRYRRTRTVSLALFYGSIVLSIGIIGVAVYGVL